MSGDLEAKYSVVRLVEYSNFWNSRKKPHIPGWEDVSKLNYNQKSCRWKCGPLEWLGVGSPELGDTQHILAVWRLFHFWNRALPSALLMAAAGGNCSLSCSLQVCCHAVVLISLAFGPIHLMRAMFLCAMNRGGPVSTQGCWGRRYEEGMHFPLSTPRLALWISLCNPSHTMMG